MSAPGGHRYRWNGLALTATAEISAGAGTGFGVLVAATSWPVGFAALALLPLAGWWILRPLVGEEEDCLAARGAPTGSYSSPTTSERRLRP